MYLFDEEGYLDSYTASLQSTLNLPVRCGNQQINLIKLCQTSDNQTVNALASYLKNSFLQKGGKQMQKSRSEHISELIKQTDNDEDNHESLSSEGISEFFPWNADLKTSRMNKSFEEKTILMKWKVYKKIYLNNYGDIDSSGSFSK